jgi:hypothetical protein
MYKLFFGTALTSAFIATFAVADKLPKGAVPLTPKEIKAVYSDHSADWSAKNKALFAADGSVKGISGESFFLWQIHYEGQSNLYAGAGNKFKD